LPLLLPSFLAHGFFNLGPLLSFFAHLYSSRLRISSAVSPLLFAGPVDGPPPKRPFSASPFFCFFFGCPRFITSPVYVLSGFSYPNFFPAVFFLLFPPRRVLTLSFFFRHHSTLPLFSVPVFRLQLSSSSIEPFFLCFYLHTVQGGGSTPPPLYEDPPQPPPNCILYLHYYLHLHCPHFCLYHFFHRFRSPTLQIHCAS